MVERKGNALKRKFPIFIGYFDRGDFTIPRMVPQSDARLGRLRRLPRGVQMTIGASPSVVTNLR